MQHAPAEYWARERDQDNGSVTLALIRSTDLFSKSITIPIWSLNRPFSKLPINQLTKRTYFPMHVSILLLSLAGLLPDVWSYPVLNTSQQDITTLPGSSSKRAGHEVGSSSKAQQTYQEYFKEKAGTHWSGVKEVANDHAKISKGVNKIVVGAGKITANQAKKAKAHGSKVLDDSSDDEDASEHTEKMMDHGALALGAGVITAGVVAPLGVAAHAINGASMSLHAAPNLLASGAFKTAEGVTKAAKCVGSHCHKMVRSIRERRKGGTSKDSLRRLLLEKQEEVEY
jgi:hypothetical protein